MSITLIIIIITCLVSFPAFSNHKMKEDLLFWPYEINRQNQFYRFLSGGVVHADTMHLLFNMVSLFSPWLPPAYRTILNTATRVFTGPWGRRVLFPP